MSQQQPQKQEPPKDQALREVLARKSTVVLCVNDPAAIKAAHTALEAYPGSVARVVTELIEARVRPDDFIVIQAAHDKPPPAEWNGNAWDKNAPTGVQFLLSGEPLDCAKHWDPELQRGAGGIVTASFFADVSKRSGLLRPCRRSDPENGTFSLGWG